MLMLSHALNWLTDRVVPLSLRHDRDVFRNAKRVAAMALVCLFWSTLFAALYTVLASSRCGFVVLLAVPAILWSLHALGRGRSPAECGNILCFAGWLPLTLLALVTGGTTAPALFWYTVLPFVAIQTAGVASGAVWTLISLVTITLIAVAEVLGVNFPQDVPDGNSKPLYFLVMCCLVICHFVLASVRVGGEQRADVALREANSRLARTREALKTLEAGFGFSVEAWEKLKREHAGLKWLVAQKIDVTDDQDGDDKETDMTDAELDRFDVDEPELQRPIIGPK
jgi:hypothetical protein